jgi:hypothetical protein
MRTGCRLILAIMLVSIILLSSMPTKTSAIPFKIEGYLKDSNGMPMPLANISISGRYYNDSAQGYQTATSYVTTNTEGYFRLYVAADEPGGYTSGNGMTVSYKNGDDILSRIVTIQGLAVWANLTCEKKSSVLDALSSTAGLVIIVMLVFLSLVVYYVYRSSAENNNTTGQDENKPKRVERRRRQR